MHITAQEDKARGVIHPRAFYASSSPRNVSSGNLRRLISREGVSQIPARKLFSLRSINLFNELTFVAREKNLPVNPQRGIAV
jgi:hypothetical protein